MGESKSRNVHPRSSPVLQPVLQWVGLGVITVSLLGCDGTLDLGGQGPAPTTPSQQSNPDAQAVQASLHRLNRLEYNNSLHELLGTNLRPADAFPPDASVGGFDNVASALNITPALMDRYFQAAGQAVDDAFADRPAFSDQLEENDPRWSYNIDRDANRIGGIIRMRGGRAQGELSVPDAGTHAIVVRAQGLINGAVGYPRMRVSLAGSDFDFDVPQTMAETTFVIELTPGEYPVSVQALNFEEFAAENRGNDILFDNLVVRSDVLVEGPARQKIMTCEPTEVVPDACASQIVGNFAKRAWRRPLTEFERRELDGLYATFRANGENVEDAIKLSLRAILTSTKFLYRYRTLEDSDDKTLLDPFVLASRLSYFLWSSTPDDRLMTAAEDGTLSTPAGIRSTVAWMLADERASALADGFAEQWLALRHLEQAAPSAEVYPQFSEALRQSMIRESKLFFLDYIGNHTSIATMLQPNFAYRDVTLATHLGIEPPDASGFVRMSTNAGDRRGVLSLSAWLTARSDSEHSSPIKRGAWVADNILCAPVPPPPAGLVIGQLKDAESGLTVRQRLEEHRSDPVCATCHTRLDVLGMGFETYDGVAQYIDDPSLDSQGELPGGTSFRGSDEMAAILDKETFVTCVSKKLFTYAVGREVNATDMKQIQSASPMMLTLPDLVTAIVLSPAFSEPSPLE